MFALQINELNTPLVMGTVYHEKITNNPTNNTMVFAAVEEDIGCLPVLTSPEELVNVIVP